MFKLTEVLIILQLHMVLKTDADWQSDFDENRKPSVEVFRGKPTLSFRDIKNLQVFLIPPTE